VRVSAWARRSARLAAGHATLNGDAVARVGLAAVLRLAAESPVLGPPPGAWRGGRAGLPDCAEHRVDDRSSPTCVV
jgi:hypothetical protein